MSLQPLPRRKNAFNLFREAAKLRSFDEFPLLRPEVDPQIYVSRNEVDQPFFVVCEKDAVIAQIGGKARVQFNESSVRHFDLSPGDYVYVPAGTPYRVLTSEAGEQIVYRARDAGRHGVVWFCDGCGAELDRMVWDSAAMPAQSGYQAASERHNADARRRACTTCGKAHAPVDMAPFRWSAVAEALMQDEDED